MSEAPPAGAKTRDYWWTVLATDPVAVPLVRLLARRRWLTPDQASAVALVLGVAVGPLFATATRIGLVAGGITFYLAFLFDCVDGKLARALGTASPRGEALDQLADAGRRASASAGLAVYLWRASDVPSRDVWWAIVYVLLAYLFLEISGAPHGDAVGGAGRRWARALAHRRLLPNPGMPDVQAIVFIVGPVAGVVVPALALGIAMVAAAILLAVWRRLR